MKISRCYPTLPTLERIPDYCSVVTPYFIGLGDLWALCSWAIMHRPVVVSPFCGKTGRDRTDKIIECLELFDWDFLGLWFYNSEITKTTKTTIPNYCFIDRFSVNLHYEEYCKTKINWKGGDRIAYCLKTHTSHHPERFLTEEQQESLISTFDRESFEIQDKWSLEKVVQELSQAVCFYTINSGLAHIALSVGVPTFVYWHLDVEKSFPNKKLFYYGVNKAFPEKILFY